MKVVILAGGFGTRIADHSNLPKPMILINGKPIIAHILDIYIKQGFNEFVIAVGFKGNVIKKYFNKNFKSYDIKIVDTGQKTLTGNRIKKLKKYLNGKNFMLTYGDGLSNVNLKKLLKFHYKHKKLVTVTAVHPPARFGELEINDHKVTNFEEKPQLQRGWINGGFFVFKKEFLDLIPNKSVMLEREPLKYALKKKQFVAYKHKDFWQCMDNRRDHSNLEKLSKLKTLPWMEF